MRTEYNAMQQAVPAPSNNGSAGARNKTKKKEIYIHTYKQTGGGGMEFSVVSGEEEVTIVSSSSSSCFLVSHSCI